MKKKRFVSAILYCLCIVMHSCDNGVQIHTDATYIVNIDSVEDRDVFYLSSLVKSVRAILLEEPDEALIGEIHMMDIFDNNIYVLDAFVAKKMFVYDMNGKFIRQIGVRGEGPNEYNLIADFCIDTEKKEIYLLDQGRTKLLKFSIHDGKHLETIKLPRGEFSYYDIAYIDNNIYFNVKYDELGEYNRLLKLDLQTGEFKNYLNNTTYCAGKPRNIAGWFIKSNQPQYRHPKYLGFYTNTVYACKSDSVYSYLTVKSKNWVRNHEIPNDGEDNELMEKERAYDIQNYYENDTCIYFQYRQGEQMYQIEYNKDTHTTYRYNSVVNDITFDTRQKHEFLNLYTIQQANSKYAYGIRMSSGFAAEALKENMFADELAKQIRLFTLEEEGWILVEYELK